MTEGIAELVDIIDAVGDVALKVLSDDASVVGLESIVAITTGVLVDSLLVMDEKVFVGGGLLIGGEEFVTRA